VCVCVWFYQLFCSQYYKSSVCHNAHSSAINHLIYRNTKILQSNFIFPNLFPFAIISFIHIYEPQIHPNYFCLNCQIYFKFKKKCTYIHNITTIFDVDSLYRSILPCDIISLLPESFHSICPLMWCTGDKFFQLCMSKCISLSLKCIHTWNKIQDWQTGSIFVL
jgi:hypothetical protein